MNDSDVLFGLFRRGGAEIRRQELSRVHGGVKIYISTEMDAGMCDDPDGPEPISDCIVDGLYVDI